MTAVTATTPLDPVQVADVRRLLGRVAPSWGGQSAVALGLIAPAVDRLADAYPNDPAVRRIRAVLAALDELIVADGAITVTVAGAE